MAERILMKFGMGIALYHDLTTQAISYHANVVEVQLSGKFGILIYIYKYILHFLYLPWRHKPMRQQSLAK